MNLLTDYYSRRGRDPCEKMVAVIVKGMKQKTDWQGLQKYVYLHHKCKYTWYRNMAHIYLNRCIETAFRKASSQFPSLIVTGPRQSGKTTLLVHLFGEEVFTCRERNLKKVL